MNKPWLFFGILTCAFIWNKFRVQSKETKKRFPDIFTDNFSDLLKDEVQILRNYEKDKRIYSFAAALVALFSIWMAIWLPHQVKVERENQHQSFLAGYSEGWSYYCDEIFDDAFNSISPNGILYAGSSQYTAEWCQGLIGSSDAEQAYQKIGGGAMSEYSDVDRSESDGLNSGYRDSRLAVFSIVPYLCFGSECISNDSETLRIEDRAFQDWKLDQEFNSDPNQ